MPKPEFIIIGAVKAATTWTAHQLNQNPALFLPGPEPHYFSTEYERGAEWYQRFFKDAAPGAMPGEKSADYLAHPEAAKRIAQDLPNAKLIVQLRNPVDRAYSDYCMLYRRGTVTDAPEKYFLSQQNSHGDRFLNSGLYAKSLSAFYDHFPAEQIHILLYEDIKTRPQQVIENISSFIGVCPYIPEAENFTKRQNDSETKLLPLPIRKLLQPVKPLAAPLRGLGWFEAFRGLFTHPMKYPPMTEKTWEFLDNFYAADVKRLGEIIGSDLSCWSTTHARNGI